MKKETIEKAAINYCSYNEQINKAIQNAIKFGANWQEKKDSEVMYSKSEMRQLVTNALVQMSDWKNDGKITPELEVLMENWFNENIKK